MLYSNDSLSDDDIPQIDFDEYNNIEKLKALVIEKEKEKIQHEKLIFDLTKRISEISQVNKTETINTDRSREMVNQMSKDINELYMLNNDLRQELDQLKHDYEIASNENIIMREHIKELEIENRQLSIIREEMKLTKLEKQQLIDKLERLESLNLSEIAVQNDTLIKKNESLNRKMDLLKDEIEKYEKMVKVMNDLEKENERMRADISILQENSKNSFYLTTEINSLRKEVQELKISNHSLEKIREKLNSNINQLHNEIIAYNKENTDLKYKLDQLENVNKDYKRLSELHKLNNQTDKQILFDNLVNQIQYELNSQSVAINERNNEEAILLKKVITDSRVLYSKIEEYEKQIDVYKQMIKSNEDLLNSYKLKSEEQENEISDSKTLISQLVSEKESFNLRCSELEGNVSKLQEELKTVRESYKIKIEEQTQEINHLNNTINHLESEVSIYKSKYEDLLIKLKSTEEELKTLKESNKDEHEKITNSMIDQLENENTSIKLKNEELLKINERLESEIEEIKKEKNKLIKTYQDDKKNYEKQISILENINKETENKIKSAIIFPKSWFKDDPNGKEKSQQIETILRRKIEEFSFAHDDNIKLREMNRILFERNKFLEEESKKIEAELSQKNETLARLSFQISNLKKDFSNVPERIKELLSELENSKVAAQAFQTHISYLERKIDELIEDKSIEVSARKDRLETYRKDIIRERKDLIDLLCIVFHGKEKEKTLEFLNDFDSLKHMYIEELIDNLKISYIKDRNVNIDIEGIFEICKTMSVKEMKSWIIQNIKKYIQK